MKTLIVVDMQNDFITGPLGTPEARTIVPKVKAKIEEYRELGHTVVFTRDTHFDDTYLLHREGRHLPIKHCIVGTPGWNIVDGLSREDLGDKLLDKFTFGYPDWQYTTDCMLHGKFRDGIEIVGVCTDICVISNALMLRSVLSEVEITVDASCCAGTTPGNHRAALRVMKSCQINVVNEEET